MRPTNALIWLLAAALAPSLVQVRLAVADEKYKGFERGGALITPLELKRLIDADDPKLVLIGVVRGGLTGSFTKGPHPGRIRRLAPGLHGRQG